MNLILVESLGKQDEGIMRGYSSQRVTTRSGLPGKAKITYDFFAGYILTIAKLFFTSAENRWADLAVCENPGRTPGTSCYGSQTESKLSDDLTAGPKENLLAGDAPADPYLHNKVICATPMYQVKLSNSVGANLTEDCLNRRLVKAMR